ncbi:hypothetical protein BX661DRAFT_175332 [Kickxella alabastrina]|uniref:uncharacterized protein n=1 Tax=Kickxella alabastrina TaxID=61397 RepID=UPI00221F859C|nr:uncharacterized protein BX661DRAFT_175332 [Kickxella alabastrina]KAI7834690.1 hypothetical protein BX661DRAFT_175332 [Kickxella alabastrina]
MLGRLLMSKKDKKQKRKKWDSRFPYIDDLMCDGILSWIDCAVFIDPGRREMLRHGFKVLLIDEFWTHKFCMACHFELEKHYWMPDPHKIGKSNCRPNPKRTDGGTETDAPQPVGSLSANIIETYRAKYRWPKDKDTA